MPHIHLILEGDGAFGDLRDRGDEIAEARRSITLTALDGGMVSGLPSVMLRLDFAPGELDGKSVVVAQTSWALLATSVKALAAKYGWPA